MSARGRHAGAAIAALAVVVVLAAGEALAFVRSTTGNAPFFWKESCVPVTIYLNHFPEKSGMTQDQIVKSVAAAAHTWSTDAVTCDDGTSPYLEIVPTLAPAAASPPVVAWDAKNSLIFRTEMWSKSGIPGHMYAFEALAVTTVTARADGHIVDADVEVNGVNQSWMNFDPGVTAPYDQGETREFFDLQNALTHEFGHLIGLDHTCFIPSADNPFIGTDGKPRPNDNDLKPIPDCDAAPSDVSQTVMFNVTSPGETSQRYLSKDDRDAVCTIYAASTPHDACVLDTATPAGCSVGAPGPGRRAGWAWGGPAGALAVAAAGFVLARRGARRG
ncbi:MAG TPA: hypothetical protein VHL80_01730 [Polyangia bacterium]|nr:hypothetical protein [Polyangia bacterium]